MIIYLIRHAEPETTEYRGFPGPGLGDTGKEQAKRIAAFLRNKPIDKILTSDYPRVLETLEPYAAFTKATIGIAEVLREREKETETHEQLTARVQNWFQHLIETQTENVALFSHCGPINVILFFLDRHRDKLHYPYECEHLCLTPKAGIWELYVRDKQLIKGQLKFDQLLIPDPAQNILS